MTNDDGASSSLLEASTSSRDKLVSRGLVRGKLFRGDFVPGDVVRINRREAPSAKPLDPRDLPLLVSDFVLAPGARLSCWIT